MKATRPLRVRGQPLGGGRLPAIVVPLAGRSRAEVLGEVSEIVSWKPDLLEWRIDFFEAAGDLSAVIDTARAIRSAAGGVPVLLTRRSAQEGGQESALGETGITAMYRAACEARCVEMIDCELSRPAADIETLRAVSRDHGIGMILSFHDFRQTPEAAALDAKFAAARDWGADAAKVAVMPSGERDVLELLAATSRAREALEIPLVSMSMGALGSFSRIVGWIYGSAASFAVGKKPSAPGQLAIEDLRTALSITHRTLAGKAPATA